MSTKPGQDQLISAADQARTVSAHQAIIDRVHEAAGDDATVPDSPGLNYANRLYQYALGEMAVHYPPEHGGVRRDFLDWSTDVETGWVE